MSTARSIRQWGGVVGILGLALLILGLSAWSVPSTLTPSFSNYQAPKLQAQATITPTITITPTATPVISDSLTATVTPTLAPTLTPMPTPTPSGASPESAREPNGAWEFIPGNSKIWYAMTDSRLKLEVWLDTNGQKGITMFVYAPEQKDLWVAKPIGQGTFNKLQPQHDLFWAGKTVAYGKWYVVVQNYNSFPVNFSLDYDRVATRVADRCAVCHGYEIGFDSCADKGDNFCENLEEEFKH